MASHAVWSRPLDSARLVITSISWVSRTRSAAVSCLGVTCYPFGSTGGGEPFNLSVEPGRSRLRCGGSPGTPDCSQRLVGRQRRACQKTGSRIPTTAAAEQPCAAPIPASVGSRSRLVPGPPSGAIAPSQHAAKIRLVIFSAAVASGPGCDRGRADSAYRSGRSREWVKTKNPDASAATREAEEDWS